MTRSMSADALAAEGRTHVKPLHLANAGFERAQRHHAGNRPAGAREEEPSRRMRVFAREPGELLLEALVGEAEAEPARIFAEELVHYRQIVGPARVLDRHRPRRRRSHSVIVPVMKRAHSPAISTRSPRSSHQSSPPRFETWRAKSFFLPSFLAQ
jgi:hypothetical protein